ncbi:MAG: hypothetical protein FLDDKLPJ_01821 [Phycisphaerae bacterium]|nr:hypothetical protein [Phycisphaerae bacterium]
MTPPTPVKPDARHDQSPPPAQAPPPSNTPKPDKLKHPAAVWTWRLVGAGLAVLIGLAPVPLFLSPGNFPDQILDDAYMYVRYADHLLDGAGVCWNRGNPPTFGLTSLGYLAWVTGVRAVTPGDPFRTLVIAGFIPAFFTPVLLLQLAARHVRPTRALSGALAAIWIVILQRPLTEHLLLTHGFTGMETAFAVFGLACAMFALDALARKTGWSWAVLAALATPLVFLLRPDLLPFPLAIAGARALCASDPGHCRQGRRELAIAAFMLMLLAAVCWVYFGTPVPLSFFAKSAGVYDEAVRAAYSGTARHEWVEFARRYVVLLVPAGVYALAVVLSSWRRTRPLDLGVVVGVVAFLTYHLFFVIPIMHYYQRFFMPALPAVAWLAFRGVKSAAASIADGVSAINRKRLTAAGVILALTIAARALLPSATLARILPTPLRPDGPGGWDTLNMIGRLADQGTTARFDIRANYRAKWTRYWFRLDAFSDLPDDLIIATTEIGHVAALNPGKRIIDLSGLNDARLLLHGFDMNAMIERDAPDLIYLPHPDYASLNAALRDSERFRTEYEVFDREHLGDVRFGLALRRSSGYYPRMREFIIPDSQRPPETP